MWWRFSIGALVGLGLVCSGAAAQTAPPASAPKPVTPAPPPSEAETDPPPLKVSWTGFYLGGAVGGGRTDAKWKTDSLQSGGVLFPPFDPTATANLNPSGVHGALFGGYNWQTGIWVFGLEGDVGLARRRGSQLGFPGIDYGGLVDSSLDRFTVRTGWDASARLRGGVLVTPTLMLFVTGGLALQQASAAMSCNAAVLSECTASASETMTKTLAGWTIGTGFEAALSEHWFWRAEYRYADFARMGHTFFASTPNTVFIGGVKIDTHTLSAGLSYKF